MGKASSVLPFFILRGPSSIHAGRTDLERDERLICGHFGQCISAVGGSMHAPMTFSPQVPSVRSYAAIRAELSRQFVLGPDSLHGPDHWQRVGDCAVHLAQVSGGDLLIARWFGLFHDAGRHSEGTDDDHGHRSALLVERYRDRLGLSAAQIDLLQWACKEHADGHTTNDPTVGACWDADRLDLPRVGITPHPQYLSTAAGRGLAAGLSHSPSGGHPDGD